MKYFQGFLCISVVVHGFTVYDRRRPRDDLNPQLWASHSETFNHPVESQQRQVLRQIAALPQLLEQNPRAEGVFKNLEFFANPQFKINWDVEKTSRRVVDHDLPFIEHHGPRVNGLDQDLLHQKRQRYVN